MTDTYLEGRTLAYENLVKTIRAHIEKGEKADARAEQHYKSAGQHLKVLKMHHDDDGGDWAGWEQLLKEIGIGKSRASDLMAIADGRKTIEQVRERTAKSVRQVRERSSPLRSGETSRLSTSRAVAVTNDEDTAVTDDMPTVPPGTPMCCGKPMRLVNVAELPEVKQLRARIAELEAENTTLRRQLESKPSKARNKNVPSTADLLLYDFDDEAMQFLPNTAAGRAFVDIDVPQDCRIGDGSIIYRTHVPNLVKRARAANLTVVSMD